MPKKMSAAEKHAGRVRIMDAVKELSEKIVFSQNDLKLMKDCFDFIAKHIEGKNWDKAKVIRLEFWFRASESSIYKNLYSEGEIVDMLNRHGEGWWYRGVALKLAELLTVLDTLLTAVNKIAKIFNKDTYRLLVSLNEEVRKRASTKKTLDDSESLRRDAAEGAKKFLELAQVVANVSELIPVPGLRDYVKYNFEMVKGAKTLFDMVRNYADRIVAELNELDRPGNNMMRKNSVWNHHHGLKAVGVRYVDDL